MKRFVSEAVRAATRELVFSKRLPGRFGSLPVKVTPGADLRVLYPGFERSANDLLIVADRLVKPGAVVWDIGANLGIFSVCCAAKAGPEGRVFALEADPKYAALVDKTFAALPASAAPCAVLAAAAADRAGVLDFGVAAKGSARSGLVAVATHEIARSKPVAAVTLDGLLEVWPAPDLVKIDVEGADLLVLKGAQRLLHEVRPTIYTEMTEATYPFSSAIFQAASYDLRRLDGGRMTPLDSFGAFVVALPPERERVTSAA